jgi:hypothetical protein
VSSVFIGYYWVIWGFDSRRHLTAVAAALLNARDSVAAGEEDTSLAFVYRLAEGLLEVLLRYVLRFYGPGAGAKN